VRATSLNYRDMLTLRKAAGRNVAGIVPLSDGAGEVKAIGSGVTSVAAGDRVAGCFFQAWREGRFQLSYHLTAWNALVKRGNMQAGNWVLALGTGGVSIFALQFAVALGASVIITSSSEEKLARARALGAAHGINYRGTPDWDKEVWRITGKRGVDHVVEVGGPGTLEKSLNSVAAEGQVALIGVLSGFGPPQGSLFPLMARNARLDGIYVGSRADFLAMNKFLSGHPIHPVVDRTFPFEEAGEAFEYLASGEHFGKVVVEVE
jgi:NADPH:quinone reductase-like Zn-dependent oxidoreductase